MIEKFSYTAYDEAGAKRQGELSAINLESAKFKLKELGLIPVSVEKPETTGWRLNEILRFDRRPGFADLEFLTAQLSLLLKNGIKIDHALLTVKKGIKNRKLLKVIEEIYSDIRSGTRLSASLEKYPDVFDPLYVSIVNVGEATGRLSDVFEELAADLGFRQTIASKTRQALIYPSVIFVVCVLAVLFIFNFIVPRFSAVFSGMANLPVYTEMLLSVSLLFRKYQVIGIPAIIGLIIFLSKIKRKERYRRWQDAVILKMPVLRRLCYDLESLRFTSSLSILLRSGVVLSESLDHAVKSIGNMFVRKRLMMVKDEVRQGKKLSETMAGTGFLPDIYNSLIEVGEQTGNLSEVFLEMQERLKRVYEERVTSFVTLIEPIMIILMGLLVGTVVVVMLLSMVSISDIDF